MNPKFSLKVIQQGQTQKVHVITPGAGLQGQALVVQAKDATRYQLADIVTLSTPEKLQMKRVGGNLHIALPGGDVDAPDIVIEDYYNVRNATVQGQTLAGEWRGYTTANLVDTAATASAEQGALPSSKGWFSSLWGNTGAQSVGMASMDSSAVSSGAGSSAGFAGMSMGTLAGVGALGALALGGGGGGGGGGSSADTSALGVIKAYASSGGTSTAPTDKTYSDSTVNVSLQAITANSTTVAAAEVLKFCNAAIALKSAADVDSASKIQSLYNSVASSLSNLLKVANGSTNGLASDSHVPTAADYLALGVKVDDAIGASGSNKTLDLLNAALADLNAVSVDTLAEVKKLAITANDVMKLAIGSSATQSDVDLIEGLNSLLGFGAASVVTTSNLSEMKAAIKDASTVTDGSDFATVTQLKTVVQTQVLKSYANASNGVNAVAPSLQTYKDAGLKVLSSLSDTDTNGTYDLVDNKSQVLGVLSTNNTTPVTESVWLGALNSGLDRLSSSSATFVADVQKMINSYYRILAEADGVVNTTTNVDVYPAGTNASSDDPLRSDYTNIGVQVGNAKSLDLLNDYVGQASDDKVDTVEEINVIAKAAYNVMRKAEVAASTGTGVDAPPGEYSNTDNAEWIAGLNKLLGLDTGTGANSSNIVAIKTAISGHADGTAVDTVREIQAIVGLSRMKAFTDDPTAFASKSTLASAPTLADWGTLVTANKTLADATRVDLNTAAYWKTTNPFNGLTALNSALDTYTLTGTQAMDVAKLQAIADSYGRILQEADGSRSTNTDVSSISRLTGLTGPDLVVADLDNIGVAISNTTGTGAFLTDEKELLASSIGVLGSTAVDTVKELNDLGVIVDNIMRQGLGQTVTYTDGEWVSSLTSLGITGANINNIGRIKTAIDHAVTTTDGNALDTWDELQSIVSMVRLNDYAAGTANADTPTLADYAAIMAKTGNGYADAKSISADYLAAYNDYVNSKSTVTSDTAIADMVKAYNQVLSYADGSRTNTPVSQLEAGEYNTLLAGTGVTIRSTGESVHLFNSVVDGMHTYDINSVADLSRLGGIVNKIIDMADATGTNGAGQTNYSGIALSREDATALGLTVSGHTPSEQISTTYYLNETDWGEFKSKVDQAQAIDINTWQKLQDLLNSVV